jgi:N-acetylglucosaminyldiphosphoundecaprenol N-acetyl-beta-D-mannosaminyltransferase
MSTELGNELWVCDGLPIQVTTISMAVERLAEWAPSVRGSDAARPVRLVNTYTIPAAQADAAYMRVLRGPGINLPDGAPLRWLARMDGVALGVVRGPTFFWESLRHVSERPLRHYLLGGTAESLGSLVERIARDIPGCHIVGSHSPPFRPVTDDELFALDAAIAAAEPDIVWVGTGTPKQDIECLRLCHRHKVVAVGVGAAFDFLAGAKAEAPGILHGTGLEWIYRLSTEPRRLWRRYVRSAIWTLSTAARRIFSCG